jgi:archaeoflavoprotein AfpA
MKFVWAITGAGDLMPEVFAVMEEVARQHGPDITAVLSQAAQKVLKWYKLTDRLEGIASRVLIEKDANTPFIAGPLQVGQYDFLLVAPLTANTAAKIAHGIADSLISNAVAQVNKSPVPAYLLPVDQRPGQTTTTLPDGSPLTLRIRPVDLENVDRIRRMEGLVVLSAPGEIKDVVGKFKSRT